MLFKSSIFSAVAMLLVSQALGAAVSLEPRGALIATDPGRHTVTEIASNLNQETCLLTIAKSIPSERLQLPKQLQP